MSRRDVAHKPFDPGRWIRSVRGRTVRVTAPTPQVVEPDRDGPGLHPAIPVTCPGCGEQVMLVGDHRRGTGWCPLCGHDPSPGGDE